MNSTKQTRTSRSGQAGYLTHALAAAVLAALNVPGAAQARGVALEAMPLSFERNLGQAPEEVQYLAHGARYAIALSRQGAALSLGGAGDAGSVVSLNVHGAGAAPVPIPGKALAGRVNYFIGDDPAKWRTNVATFGEVRYAQVYPGIDLVYYGTQGRLEYDFTVAPGADARAIGLEFQGGQSPRIGARGDLTIAAGAQAMTFERPVAYQVVDGQRHLVSASYRLKDGVVGFRLGHYDHARALVIDPVLSYLTYLGGSDVDVIGHVVPSNIGGGIPPSQAIAVDGADNVYVVGHTASTDFPTHAPFAPVKAKTAGHNWAFVSKISADGSSLIYSTYLGGSNGDDYAYGIAVDASGNAFVTGNTASSDFPVSSGAFQSVCAPNYGGGTRAPGCGPSGQNGAFVSKLSPTGALLASTFLGGTASGTEGVAVAVDAAGRPYVVGSSYPGEVVPAGAPQTREEGFPVTAGALVAPYQYAAGVNLNGELQYDMFVSVFSADLKTLVYSTLIGDTQAVTAAAPLANQANTVGAAITLDAAGNIYLAARTQDAYVPTTAGSRQPHSSSCGTFFPGTTVLNARCGYVAKLSPVGGASPPTLLYGSYLGAAAAGQVAQAIEITSLAVDPAGDLYVLGYDNQAGFPTTAGAFQTTCDGFDGVTHTDASCAAAFVAKLNPAGSALLASTYFGCLTCNGDAVYIVAGIALDAAGNVYFSGIAGDQLPLVNGFPKAADAGGAAPFIVEMDGALKTVKLATLVNAGGAGQIAPAGLVLDSAGAIYVAGSTNAPLTPSATTGALQGAYGGSSSDGFIAKVSLATVAAATSTSLTVAPASANTGTAVTFTATVSETSGGAVPTGTVKFMNGPNMLGSADLSGIGVATFSSSTLAAGSYSVVAAYQGDSNNAASDSTAMALSITTPAPAAPTVTISVSPASITVGASATLTWSSTNATGCTASSAWSGSQATSGTTTVTPTAAGSLSYALGCTGAGGTANGAAALTVNAASGGGGSTPPPASGGGGGGGAVDVFTVLGLVGAAVLSLTRRARRRS